MKTETTKKTETRKRISCTITSEAHKILKDSDGTFSEIIEKALMLYRDTNTQSIATKRKPLIPQASPGDHMVIFTDGSSIGNPGPGGYGVVLLSGSTRRELSGGFMLTTNNRMELMACIVALKELPKGTSGILHSDSRYVVDGISKGWAKKWKQNGWLKGDKKPASNSDLWKVLLKLTEERNIKFQWVKGHNGNPENERCDQLANDVEYLQVDEGYQP